MLLHPYCVYVYLCDSLDSFHSLRPYGIRGAELRWYRTRLRKSIFWGHMHYLSIPTHISEAFLKLHIYGIVS